MNTPNDTIVAPATAAGGAIAVVRMSGPSALAICDTVFSGARRAGEAAGYTVLYGTIADGARVLDDVLVTVFRAPHSYTGEDAVEISCHGSRYIVRELLALLVRRGARMATPGEFTSRAFLGGKLDLSQAEAVADLIASGSRAAHTLATDQMRGGYSAELETLRGELLRLASLLELELDFGEEEVEFADRTQLRDTMRQIKERIDALRSSFSLGNAIKEGVAVAIVGAPNVGKSTLLNRLLNEERAMVSDIAGTTRDVIEERANIDGIVFRFLDTAGIRSTNDTLEQMGIARTMSSIERAQIIIRLIDASQPAVPVSGGSPSSGQTGRKSAPAVASADSAADTPSPNFPLRPDQTLLTVYNKIDKTPRFALPEGAVGISARNGDGIDDLRRILRDAVDTEALYHGGTVISNSRHYEALTSASEALSAALDGLRDNLPTDLLSEEIRQVIRHLSGVTGQDIVPEEVLKTIFSKFCIGK